MQSTLKNVPVDLPNYDTVLADFTVQWREDERTGRLILIGFHLDGACVDGEELEGAALVTFRNESADDMERYAWPALHYNLQYYLDR